MPDAMTEQIIERLRALEAREEVRKTIARYMALCDVPSRPFGGESLAALFRDVAVWEGIAHNTRTCSGVCPDRATSSRCCRSIFRPRHTSRPTFTFLTSEHIDVNGDEAQGRWIMLQASDYVDAKAELIAAKLEVDFTPSPHNVDVWLIRHFRTERVCDAPWHVNPAQGVSA